MRQVVSGPRGQRYRMAAAPSRAASLLAGTEFIPGLGAEEDEPWEVRIDSERATTRVFEAANGEIAERLMVILGEELETGLLEL